MKSPVKKAPEGRTTKDDGFLGFDLPLFYKISLSVLIVVFIFWVIMEMYGDMIGGHKPKTLLIMDWTIFCNISAAMLLGLSGLIIHIFKK